MKILIANMENEITTYEGVSDIEIPESRDEPFIFLYDNKNRCIAAFPVDFVSGIFIDHEDEAEEQDDIVITANAKSLDTINTKAAFERSNYWSK
jgi:hypothetical protein